MTTKQLDSKGRLSLGARFANQLVIVDDSDENHIVITPAKVVPAYEAWLHENQEAFKMVAEGLSEARAGKFAADKPDLNAAWIEELND